MERAFLWGDANVLKLDWGAGCRTLNCTIKTGEIIQ